MSIDSRMLPVGYQLHNYRIEQFLGEGGFGITYRATDLNLNRPVAIKEFIPSTYSVRSETGDVESRDAESADVFRTGLRNFVKEAQALALFKHDNIVQVYTFLRYHNTAYIVMEYVEGITMSEWLRKNPDATEKKLVDIICPILQGLHELHRIGLLHRDIKPDNIYICKDNRPVLLDFGAVKYTLPQDESTEMSAVVLTEGYAPPEQYGKSGQGPWTDVYAAGACLFFAISRRKVVGAMERITQVSDGRPDPQPLFEDVTLNNEYSAHFLSGIERAISLRPSDRTESALALRNSLLNISQTPSDTQETEARERRQFRPENPQASEADGAVGAEDEVTIARETARMSTVESSARDSQPVGVIQRSPSSRVMVGCVIGVLVLAGAGYVALKGMKSNQSDNHEEVLVQLNQKMKVVDDLNLPKATAFQAALEKRQLAIDIMADNVAGTTDEVSANLADADDELREYIISAGSTRNLDLLGQIREALDMAQKRGVQDIGDIAVDGVSTKAIDVVSVVAQNDQLQQMLQQIENAMEANKRVYVIGSSELEIDDALEVCRQYSEDCQRDWYEDELERSVLLSPFALDQSEVTLGQYGKFAEENDILTSAEIQGFSYLVDPDNNFAAVSTDGINWRTEFEQFGADAPAVHLNRSEVAAYCESEGKRLTSEGEWEYVARGLARDRFPWGDEWEDANVLWEKRNSVNRRVNEFDPETSGYFDMAGSVTEWTSTDADETEIGVLKGGSRFDNNMANFRFPVRRLESTDYTGEDIGFRCARDVDKWPDAGQK